LTFLVKITYTKDVPGLGQRIRDARKASSLSLAQLAAAAGISVPHWSRIENEKVGELPIETLRGIETALRADFGVQTDRE